ncbi:hypothetical protein L1D14_10730 [Vibrio tubiashii]|uniref:reprolysin-like metallopeptidase n=1 Tax=Vibrio tubiashii TaxID=29498 RepID=UPI001EFC6F9D|nr:hypothetical protein [Vibrio tubiashii]MCG9576713.1 hypothetical protein [Vibrio tubiashii]
MNNLKVRLIALLFAPIAAQATTYGVLNHGHNGHDHANCDHPHTIHTIESYSQSSSLTLPACSVDYANLSKEHIQRVGFYVTEDVLDYATKEEVVSWIDAQLAYSNQALKNSCVEFQQEVAVLRFVETPNNQPDYGNNFVYNKEDLTADLYQSIIAGLDVDDMRSGTTPMGRTSDTIKTDWKNLGFDRIVNVRPYYKASGRNGIICGVAYGNWSRPNKASPTWLEAPENFWGASQPHSDAFATVVYPNDSICSSVDVVAHELGHTNGLTHERQSKPEINYEDTLGFAAECNGQRSIMWSGTNNYRSVPFFSSPNISAQGVPCGDAATSWGVDSAETLKYQLGTSLKHNSPRTTPFQGVVDAGNSMAVGDTSTWNTITSNRYANMPENGTTSLSSVPAVINEGNGTFSIDVSRSDSTSAAKVIVRAYGDGNVIAGKDLDYEKEVSFGVGESLKTVSFATTDSGLFRQNGQITFKLEAPYQVALGSNKVVTATFNASKLGNSGKVKVNTLSTQCASGCQGTVNLVRQGGTDGAISVDVVYRLNGAEVSRDTVTFAHGEDLKTSTYSNSSISAVTVDLQSSHPSLVDYSRVSFSSGGGTSPTDPTTPEGGSGGGGGGGSLGFLSLLLLWIPVLRRKN